MDDTVCLRPGGVGNVPKWMEGAKGSRVMAVGKKPATVAAPFSAPASATAWGASKYRPPEVELWRQARQLYS